MAKIVGKLWILVALITMPLLVIGLLAFFHSRAGATSDVSVEESSLFEHDLSAVPQSVLEDVSEEDSRGRQGGVSGFGEPVISNIFES